MDLITLLQTVVRARFRSVVLFHSPSVPPEAIGATVAAHIGKKTTVGRLRSDAISEEEAVFIHDALFEDRALVLIGGASNELPAKLLKAWESFAEMPRHAYAQAGRFIHFEPDDVRSKSAKGEDVLGTLILVLPKDYPHRVDPRAQMDRLARRVGSARAATRRRSRFGSAVGGDVDEDGLFPASPRSRGCGASRVGLADHERRTASHVV